MAHNVGVVGYSRYTKNRRHLLVEKIFMKLCPGHVQTLPPTHQYTRLKMQELKAIARECGVVGYSHIKTSEKESLVEMIMEAKRSPPSTTSTTSMRQLKIQAKSLGIKNISHLKASDKAILIEMIENHQALPASPPPLERVNATYTEVVPTTEALDALVDTALADSKWIDGGNLTDFTESFYSGPEGDFQVLVVDRCDDMCEVVATDYQNDKFNPSRIVRVPLSSITFAEADNSQ